METEMPAVTSRGIAKYFFLLIVFVIVYPNILNILNWIWWMGGNTSSVFASVGIPAYVIFLGLDLLYVFVVFESMIHIESIFRGQHTEYMIMERREKKVYMREVIKSIGFFRNKETKPIVIGIVWLAGVSVVLIVSLGFERFLLSFLTFWVPWRVLIFSLSSLAEEIMFRYGLFRHLRILMKGRFWPYVISSAVFAAMHFYSFGLTSSVEHVIGTFFLGLILAWIYESADYSIYPSWIVHMIGDVIAFSIT